MSEPQYSSSRNSFHLLRFILAALVILGNSYTLLGRTSPLSALSGGLMSESRLAVEGALVVSGFLLCQSVVRSKNALTFLGKRILRIGPGLICALLFSAMLVGALVYDGSVVRYVQLGQGGPLAWMLNQLTLGFTQDQSSVTGVFSSNPTAGLNLNLWTLRYLAALWLLMALFRLTTLSRRRPTYMVCFAVFLILRVLLEVFGVRLWDADSRWWLLSRTHYDGLTQTGLCFFTGAVLYAYRREIPRRWYLALIAALLLCGSCVLRLVPVQADAAAGMPTHMLWQLAMLPLRLIWYAALPYLIVYLGSSPLGSGFARIGDLSLGMYLLSCPIQQMIIHCAPDVKPLPLFLLALAITVPLAAWSWRSIEAPALRLR